MSAVIGTGFAMSHCDLPRLHQAIADLRAVIRPMARRAHAKAVAEQVCFMIDRSIAIGGEWTRNPLLTVLRRIEDDSRKVERTGIRDPLSDFGFEIWFLPDPQTDSIYGVMNCEHAEWRRRWMRRPEVRDFSWWNNAERPSGVRSGEWSAREEVWERILPSGTYADHCMTARISPTTLIHTAPNPMKHQPDLERRRTKIAMEMLYGELIREQNPDPDAGDLIQAIMKASAEARKPRNVERLAELTGGVRIPRRIDMGIAVSAERPANTNLDLA